MKIVGLIKERERTKNKKDKKKKKRYLFESCFTRCEKRIICQERILKVYRYQMNIFLHLQK